MAIFGYNTIGSVTSGALGGDTLIGSRFTAPESGTLNSISAYVRLDSAGTAPMRVAIFANTGSNTIGSLIASSAGTVDVTNTSFAWVSVPITASLVGGTDYWIFAWIDTTGFSGTWRYVADVNAIANSIALCWANSAPSWSTVGDGSNEAYDLAYVTIIGDYTPANPLYGKSSFTSIQSFTGIKSISF